MSRPWLALAALTAACGTAVPDPDLSAPARVELGAPVELTLEAADHNPLVRAVLPGHGVARLMVDTGAQSTWLDADYAERAGLEVRRLRRPLLARGVDSEREFWEYAVVPRLELGGAAALDVLAPLQDLSPVEIGDEPLDGILGQDVLGGLVGVFDGPGARLLLLPGSDVLEHLRTLFVAGTAAARFETRWSEGTPVLDLDFGEHGTFPFTVDTGTTSSTFPVAALEGLGVPVEGENESFAIGGLRTVTEYRIEELSLDMITIRDLVVSGTDRPRGLLGWDPLQFFVSVLDGPGGTFWLLHEPEWR